MFPVFVSIHSCLLLCRLQSIPQFVAWRRRLHVNVLYLGLCSFTLDGRHRFTLTTFIQKLLFHPKTSTVIDCTWTAFQSFFFCFVLFFLLILLPIWQTHYRKGNPRHFSTAVIKPTCGLAKENFQSKNVKNKLSMGYLQPSAALYYLICTVFVLFFFSFLYVALYRLLHNKSYRPDL